MRRKDPRNGALVDLLVSVFIRHGDLLRVTCEGRRRFKKGDVMHYSILLIEIVCRQASFVKNPVRRILNGMSGNGTNTIGRYIKYAIIFLAVLLVVLSFFLIRDYVSLRREQIIGARELRLSNLLKDHGPLTAADVTVIRPWMTFSYINTLFKIPPDYLKTDLSVTDPSYPQLSLYGYAKYQHADITTVVNQVERSLSDHLTAATIATNTPDSSTK
jgi:hypothetical protein